MAIFSEFGVLLGTLFATLCGHGSYLAPFRDVMQLFWLAFSAYARLELQREPFQHHFDDLVSFPVPLLRIFEVTLAENAHNSLRSLDSFRASFFFSIFSIRAQRSGANPVRGRGRAAGAARRPLRRYVLFRCCG